MLTVERIGLWRARMGIKLAILQWNNVARTSTCLRDIQSLLYAIFTNLPTSVHMALLQYSLAVKVTKACNSQLENLGCSEMEKDQVGGWPTHSIRSMVRHWSHSITIAPYTCITTDAILVLYITVYSCYIVWIYLCHSCIYLLGSWKLKPFWYHIISLYNSYDCIMDVNIANNYN